MASKYKVANLKEALALANEFKLSNQYNLFRGQAQNWQVVPTVGRLSSKSFDNAKELISRLYYFFETNTPLKKFINNVDWFYAVAQHYGIPTSYIDFSTKPEIAAFFATNSGDNKIGEDCVIICLNETDFNDFVNQTKGIYENDKVIAPYISKINVDNLWRLQAQHGCFLYTPYANLECYYDFDRIIFPFSNPFNDLQKKEIYPERKSELEILLDHFFNSESKIEGQERMKRFIAEVNMPSVSLPPLKYDSLLKNNEIHLSWNSADHDKWIYSVKEEWNISNPEKTIKLQFDQKSENQINEIIEKLSTFFQNNIINRTDNLIFEIITKPKLTPKLSKIINRSCSRIWDGMRNLPYTDTEIINIISKYIYFEIFESKYDKTPSLSNDEMITLELTNEYGSMTKCYASENKIVSSYRTDIKNVLIDKLTTTLSSEILMYINQPNLLFDFNKLTELFKDEIIPYQVLYNSEDTNPVIFYSPSQIKIMGYA